jgi:hypothetical protein
MQINIASMTIDDFPCGHRPNVANPKAGGDQEVMADGLIQGSRDC